MSPDVPLDADQALLAAWIDAESEGRPFDRAEELRARLAVAPALARAATEQLELAHLLRRSAAPLVAAKPLDARVARALDVLRWRRYAAVAAGLLISLGVVAGFAARRTPVLPEMRLAADCRVEPVFGARYTITGERTLRLDAGELRLAVDGPEPLIVASSLGTIRADGRSRLMVGVYPSPRNDGDTPMPSRFFRALVLAGAALMTTSHGALLGGPGELLAGEPEQAPRRLARSHAEFAFDLHRELARLAPDENRITAPHSVASALALAYLGARGDTAAELARVLRLPREEGGELAWEAARVAAAQGALDTELDVPAAEGHARATSAAALWADRALPLRPALVGDLGRARAGLFALDFAGDPAGSCRTANAWIARNTNGEVADLVRPEAVARAGVLITTAVRFTGEWTTPFDKSSTQNREFMRADGSKVEVSAMSHTNARNQACAVFDAAGKSVPWSDKAIVAPGGFRAAELAYKGGRYGFLVLLPNRENGLPELERLLNETALERVVAALDVTECEVVLPKLDLKSHSDLRSALEALGLVAAFSSKADFGGLFGEGAAPMGASLGAVEHAAYLRCDERGTEAGGATSIPAASDVLQSLIVLRPFAFVLRDRTTGTVLFTGRVMDPSR